MSRPDQAAGTHVPSLELSAPRYSLFIHAEYIHAGLSQNIIFQVAMISMHKIGNIGFSPLVHISKWPLIIFHDHMINGYFSLNAWPFQHKKKIMLKERADASFFLLSLVFDVWPQALFAAHYSNAILTTELLLSTWVFPMASMIIVSECFRNEQLTILHFTSVSFLYSWTTSDLLNTV